MFSEVLKIRYTKPLQSLSDGWLWKTILAGATYVLDLLFGMFQTNVELVALLGIAIIIDWITGRIASRRKGTPVVSLGLRQTIVKILEYTGFLLIIIGISNVFGDSNATGWVSGLMNRLSHIEYPAFLYAIYTELKSIQENVTDHGNSTIGEIWEQVKDQILDSTKE